MCMRMKQMAGKTGAESCPLVTNMHMEALEEWSGKYIHHFDCICNVAGGLVSVEFVRLRVHCNAVDAADRSYANLVLLSRRVNGVAWDDFRIEQYHGYASWIAALYILVVYVARTASKSLIECSILILSFLSVILAACTNTEIKPNKTIDHSHDDADHSESSPIASRTLKSQGFQTALPH